MNPSSRRRVILGVLVAALSAAIVLLGDRAGAAGQERRGVGFELRSTRITPAHPLFDGERRIRLHYRFAARRPVELRITVLRISSDNVVRVYRERGARPGRRLTRVWNGLNRRGGPVPDGRYELRVGPAGERDRYAGRLRLHGHVFPVDGRHGTRGAIGEFGAPRSGGRTHEGFDVTGSCGTPLLAARGGKIKRAGYDPQLYGNYALIDAYKSRRDYFYAHMSSPARLRHGERVRTGEMVGRVGQTGNAASTPCHLHFEIRSGRQPIDPEPKLRRWDRWS